MRPAGDVKLALLKAAAELATPERAPTLRELAEAAQVGQDAALHTVRNMVRAGDLVIARLRRVSYRNRPVAEYAAPPVSTEFDGTPLGRVMSSWMG